MKGLKAQKLGRNERTLHRLPTSYIVLDHTSKFKAL